MYILANEDLNPYICLEECGPANGNKFANKKLE